MAAHPRDNEIERLRDQNRRLDNDLQTLQQDHNMLRESRDKARSLLHYKTRRLRDALATIQDLSTTPSSEKERVHRLRVERDSTLRELANTVHERDRVRREYRVLSGHLLDHRGCNEGVALLSAEVRRQKQFALRAMRERDATQQNLRVASRDRRDLEVLASRRAEAIDAMSEEISTLKTMVLRLRQSLDLFRSNISHRFR